MSSPIDWWWPALAGIAAIVAIAAGPVYLFAVPAATVAVIAAALTLVEPLRRRRAGRSRPMYAGTVHVGSIRGAFAGGEPGREDIVLTVDLLERKIARPDLPARTGPQVAAEVRRSAPEFREYLAHRLDELEARS